LLLHLPSGIVFVLLCVFFCLCRSYSSLFSASFLLFWVLYFLHFSFI
jgi:hypothetical protein